MFDQILIPVQEAGGARAALEYGSWLAAELTCDIILVTAIAHSEERGRAESLHSELTTEGTTPAAHSVIVVGEPSQAILDVANESTAPAIVMTTRAHGGVRELLFGSVASRVLRAVGHPMVLLGPVSSKIGIRPPRISELVVCLDGSPASRAILPLAEEAARRLDLSVVLLHVIYPLVDPTTGDAQLSREDKEMYDLLDSEARAWNTRGLNAEWDILQGTWPPAAIVEYVTRRGSGLVAMSTHGRSALSKALVGSTTTGVVKNSPIPVLTVRPSHLLH